jgi:hypothetical protein
VRSNPRSLLTGVSQAFATPAHLASCTPKKCRKDRIAYTRWRSITPILLSSNVGSEHDVSAFQAMIPKEAVEWSSLSELLKGSRG